MASAHIEYDAEVRPPNRQQELLPIGPPLANPQEQADPRLGDGSASRVADVAVPLPIDKPFTYAVPEDMAAEVTPGARVLIPFGSRRLLGVVIEVRPRRDDETRLKPIAAVVDAVPVLPPELLSFLRELADYYLAPLGEVVALALPAVERKAVIRLRKEGLGAPPTSKIAPSRTERVVRATLLPMPDGARISAKALALLAFVRENGEIKVQALATQWPTAAEMVKRLHGMGVVEVEDRPVATSPFDTTASRDRAPELTDEQRAAVEAIVVALPSTTSTSTAPPSHFLLHGVTGSGKTEVYLHAIAETLARGRGALVLVPEIALTPQLLARFRARFGDEVAVVHSALDPSSRHAMWKRLHAGELRVAIGARSALFAPVPALGLVVVDEEHDASFKQEEGVRYHARDCALLRAHRAGAVCVLGSATPSLESFDLARRGKLHKIVMHLRARAQPLPSVQIIDLRRIGPGPSGSKLISLPLHRGLEATLLAKEQAILFLNRRGFAPAVICESCGELRRCPDCDVALTLHNKAGIRAMRNGDTQTVPAGLRCHYCDRVETLPPRCPKCNGRLAQEGIGTERLQEVLTTAFPQARVGRLDRDVASGKEVEAVLARMRRRELDILVGTQMVTKGHDLPHVTLVGVVNADGALSMPDFRAAERTFQLLVQVAGRAGRGDAKGTVMVQTRAPDHPAIVCAARHDVDAFLERELRDREELGYPPWSRLVLVRLDGPDEARVARLSQLLCEAAQTTDEVRSERVEVRGPTPAPVPRVRARFRYRLMLRGARREVRAVARVVKQAAAEAASRDVRVMVDVDPLAMM